MFPMRSSSVQATLRLGGTRVDKNVIARNTRIRNPFKTITVTCQLTYSDRGHAGGLIPGTKDKNLTKKINAYASGKIASTPSIAATHLGMIICCLYRNSHGIEYL